MLCRYNIEYPALYADEKNCPNEAVRLKFNCTQVRGALLAACIACSRSC